MTEAEARAPLARRADAAEPILARRLPPMVVATIAAAAIGVVAQVLFFDTAVGINFPIAIALLLACGWLVRDADRPAVRPVDALLPALAIVFASLVAIRGDTRLQVLDALGGLALTGASIASLGGLQVVTRPAGMVTLLAGKVLGSVVAGAARALGGARRALPEGRLRLLSGRAAPVLRGLLIALPLLLIFAVLFASADAVFQQYFDDLWDIDLGSLPGRLAIALIAFWLAAGALAFVAEPREPDAEAAGRSWERRPRIGSTEAIVVLVALDALFAFFVALQGAYLFGGLDTLQASGLTYAEYARRGFFELLVVAVGVAGLITLLQLLVRERSRVYVLAAAGLVAMTLVVLASAFLRIRLYQDAYGWTELRFYVVAAILWLGIGSALAIGAILTNRFAWIGHAMIGVSILFGLVFNAIGPVRFIAEQNVARALHPELVPPDGSTGLDVEYLASLDTDAIVVVADALPTGFTVCMVDELRDAIQSRWLAVASDPHVNTWQAWNLGREQARQAMPNLYTPPRPAGSCP